MRLKNLFGMAAMLALAASCSENELVESGGTSQAGTSYAAFNIVLPTTNGTRAVSYDDGDDNEYNVNDGAILIFEQTASDEYVFIESSTLDVSKWEKNTDDGITTEASVTAKLSNVTNTGSANYYALVLLNYKGAVDLPIGGTYSAWNNQVLSKVANDFTGPSKDDFLMSNAALKASASSDGIKKGVLVKIDKTKIAATKEDAKEAAATIHVERAVAKVTVNVKGGTNTINVTGSSTDAVEFKNWDLDVTNKKTFAVQNISGLDDAIWNYKKGDVNYTVGLQNRLFWAIDPNYNNGKLSATGSDGDTERNNNFNYITTDGNIANSMNAKDYCLENTFDLNNMKQGQTTRVLFKAQYKVSGSAATFYMVGKNTEMLNETNLSNRIQSTAQEIFNATGKSYTITINLGDIKTAASSKHKIAASNILVNGTAIVPATSYGEAEKAKTGEQIITEVNNNLGISDEIGISTYLNGVTYYIARIKHFGDDYTPWNSGEPYGSDNAKYLGRYGVLRNNWYELTVNSVSGPGYPTIPPVKPETPDDESDKYIKCDIKILSWAKRTQGVDL